MRLAGRTSPLVTQAVNLALPDSAVRDASLSASLRAPNNKPFSCCEHPEPSLNESLRRRRCRRVRKRLRPHPGKLRGSNSHIIIIILCIILIFNIIQIVLGSSNSYYGDPMYFKSGRLFKIWNVLISGECGLGLRGVVGGRIARFASPRMSARLGTILRLYTGCFDCNVIAC